jgi:putative tricarboxylic transport membrane protein
MTIRRADFALGIAAILLSAAWLHGASRIPDSLLSDAVGAAGLPRAVGWVMAVVGLLLCVRSLRGPAQGEPAKPQGANAARRHLRALGLLAILAGYVVLAPWLGYAATTGLLVAAGAAHAGARGRNLMLIPLAAAVVFWLLFVVAFGIPMPGSALLG